jgi:hypothetical protein
MIHLKACADNFFTPNVSFDPKGDMRLLDVQGNAEEENRLESFE